METLRILPSWLVVSSPSGAAFHIILRRFYSGADFAPGLALPLHQPTVGGCREAMPPRREVVAHGTEGLQEALRLLSRLEALHAPLPLTCRQVGILRPVIQPLVTSILGVRQHAPQGRWVTRQLVGDDHPRRVVPPSDGPPYESLGRVLI